MSIESNIRAALITDSAVSALVGGRVYPVVLGRDATFPAITYTRISGGFLASLSGTNREHPRIQIDCWAETYAEAKDLSAKVRAAMDGATAFKSIAVSDYDGFEDGAEVFCTSIDFSVWG